MDFRFQRFPGRSVAVPALLSLAACLPAQQERAPRPGDPAFERTWHTGVAELNTYDLVIERYGAVREGRAVLVYVTEPFRPDAQVKAESEGGERVQVLKLNRIERFVTGVYDYSMMTSVFLPYGRAIGATLKVTTSVQDWCGHVWLQLNRRGARTEVTGHSYFEAEGETDEELSTDDALWEDGLWTRIRLDPRALPTGTVSIVPGTMFSRLRHQPLAVRTANASLREMDVLPDGAGTAENVLEYTVDYGDRALRLRVDAAWPHALVGWVEEAGPSGDRNVLARATRVAVERSPYWNRNDPDSLPMRDSLGLPRGFRADVDR